MVAVFDIGNTNIHVGIYDNRRLSRTFVFPVRTRLPVTKIKKIVTMREVKGAAIASVVPRLTRQIENICKQRMVDLVIVTWKSTCGLKYRYHNPATLGADRIAAVVGALSRYGRDVIVIDAGTATTIDVAKRDGEYLGGIICPGMQILAEMMHRKTAQLPMVSVRKPRNLIGRSTEECIQSGLFNGTVAMVSGLVKSIRKSKKGNFLCVATGGAGKLLSSCVEDIQKYDADLCMYGVLNIYYKNV